MIQWAEGVGMGLSRLLVPVVKRSLTHDETNHPCRHGAAFPLRATYLHLNCI